MTAPAPSEPRTLVIGTAGHIDHGKSRLVLALTGTDPDRLPEEQARGLTIDLGFAHMHAGNSHVSFVDVPGHERFIRNMVAGATGVDLALLVVAADDSVMPQTREHAEVLHLLGIDRCVLVLTKIELVDAEWAAIVEAEARELLRSLAIDPLACVRTSAETGEGIDALRELLLQEAARGRRSPLPYRWFRLPIDRSFTVAGRGTVVTGSITHGSVRRDEELDLWPAGRRVRVRDLQSHHDRRETAIGRMRLALNVAAVGVDETGRGCELATSEYLLTTQCLDVWLPLLRMPGKTRPRTIRLRLHMATRDVLAELRLLDNPADAVVRDVFAQLRVAEPVVATWGQHFILRDEAATRTLGGGRVLRPYGRRWTSRHPACGDGLQTLLHGEPRARLEETVRDERWCMRTDPQLSAAAGLADADDARRVLDGLCDRARTVEFESGGLRMLVHADVLAEVAELVERRLREHVAANPRSAGVPRQEFAQWMPKACPPRLRAALADWFATTGRVVLANERILPPGHGDVLPPADQGLLEQILSEYAAAAYQPPPPEALRCRTDRTARRVDELVKLAVARGRLVQVAPGLLLHADRWDELVQRVVAQLERGAGLTVAEVRTLLDSSRKFVVPIVEKLDALGITRRVGDQRVRGPKGNVSPGAAAPRG